jgi:hypothetical protein
VTIKTHTLTTDTKIQQFLNPDETQACLYYNAFTRSYYEKDVKIVANNTISGKYLPEYLL